jgi:small subunit ribosomal protein S20
VAHTRSAKKRIEITRKRTERNRRIKSSLKTAIKRFHEALAEGNQEEIRARLRKALVSIDKAVTKGILHKNTAARRKSRLTKKANAAS